MTKDNKLLPYRHLAPRNKGKRKPRKPVSEDEESDDSTAEEQTQEKQRSPSPMPDEPTVKLPEVSFDDKIMSGQNHNCYFNRITGV